MDLNINSIIFCFDSSNFKRRSRQVMEKIQTVVPLSIIFQALNKKQMDETIANDLELYKDRIPEFIMKLYHILGQKEYEEYLMWHGDGQIVIKGAKKLEEKVLPHFFRHRHLASFIRQLNMYKFSKVTKLTKEKNYMYFKNQFFRRGCIKDMIKIKRNTKNARREESLSEYQQDDAQDVSLQIAVNSNQSNQSAYKEHVKRITENIVQCLQKMQDNPEESRTELNNAIRFCNDLLERQEPSKENSAMEAEQEMNSNMLSTIKLFPNLEYGEIYLQSFAMLPN